MCWRYPLKPVLLSLAAVHPLRKPGELENKQLQQSWPWCSQASCFKQAAIYCQRECQRKPNTAKVTAASVIAIRYAISGIARSLYVSIVKWNAKDNTRATVATDITVRYDISGMHGFLAYTVFLYLIQVMLATVDHMHLKYFMLKLSFKGGVATWLD